jgi:diacylglycerol kinase family enzyme
LTDGPCQLRRELTRSQREGREFESPRPLQKSQVRVRRRAPLGTSRRALYYRPDGRASRVVFRRVEPIAPFARRLAALRATRRGCQCGHSSMKRALLIWNPAASTTSPGVRDVIARALASDLQVEVAETRQRDDATDIASAAATHGDVDLTIVLGGDGTINEVINGLAGTQVALAPIPCGGTNVFARTLGYPNDPVEATSKLLDNIRAESTRTIPLGRINGRAFAFCAGVGFDARVVRAVESSPAARRVMGEGLFVASALRLWVTPGAHWRSKMEVRWETGEVRGARLVVVGNSDPYTYLGRRPFRLVPDATLDHASLDATILRSLGPLPVGRILASSFRTGSHHPAAAHTLRSLRTLTVSCAGAVPYQVDGDVVGEASDLAIWSEPSALRVIA